MKVKKLAVILTSAMLLGGAFSVTAFAANVTEASALAAAKALIPSDSMLLRTEVDYDTYDFKFYSESRKENYEVDVSRFTGKVVEFDSDLSGVWGSQTATITLEAAKKAVTDEIEGAEILSAYLDADDWLKEYKISFRTSTLYGDYEVHPQTGVVMERSVKFIPTQTTQVQSQATQSQPQTSTNNRINVANGASSTPVRGSSLISAEQAKQIALSNAPGASLRKLELDYDDGIAVYEVELRNGRIEYDFEINASNGNIIDFDIDYD